MITGNRIRALCDSNFPVFEQRFNAKTNPMLANIRDVYITNNITITHVSLFIQCRHYITHSAKKMYASYLYVLEPEYCSRGSHEKSTAHSTVTSE